MHRMQSPLFLLLAMLLALGLVVPGGTLHAREQTVVFLVRHAEKVDDSHNPPLSEAGEARAETLASLLADADIQRIYSTDYRRSRQTAAPLAERLDIKVRSYDPRTLQSLADGIKHQGGRHLVVGHSNTTTELVRLLGGDPGDAIDEASEYDRLYVLTFDSRKKVTTVLLRYGTPYHPPEPEAQSR